LEIIDDLDKSHKVDSNKWIDFILKAISLSEELNFFESIKVKALEKFKDKFKKQAKKAKENIESVEIVHYSSDIFF
jgi:hypothetical protein